MYLSARFLKVENRAKPHNVWFTAKTRKEKYQYPLVKNKILWRREKHEGSKNTKQHKELLRLELSHKTKPASNRSIVIDVLEKKIVSFVKTNKPKL